MQCLLSSMQCQGVECRFFEWHDDPNTSFLNSLLNKLRDTMYCLKTEKKQLEESRIQVEARMNKAIDVEVGTRQK